MTTDESCAMTFGWVVLALVDIFGRERVCTCMEAFLAMGRTE